MRYSKAAKAAWMACVLALPLLAQCSRAQSAPTDSETTETALHAMSQLAAVIFTGQVVAVRQHATAGSPAGVVEIEFAVQDAVRGVSGGAYIMREWAGLWAGGDVPFRVGQRYLMLLHAAGANGLSSPVDGMNGAIPLTATGTAVGPNGTLGGETAETAAADGLAVDMRWVGTRVVRSTGYVTPVAARPILVGADGLSSVSAQDLPAAVVASGNAPIETVTASAATSATYATVLGMLRSWEKNDQVAN